MTVLAAHAADTLPRPLPRTRTASLLDLDPDLAASLPESALEDARRELLTRIVRLGKGPLALGEARDGAPHPGHLGLLLLDGLVARELLTDDVVSLELMGPGDLLRPRQPLVDEALLAVSVRWSVLSEARVAVIDQRAGAQLAHYPAITAALIDRVTARSQRLAITQAISQLNRVDRRVLTMLWHLAGRWGRVTSRGTLVPLSLSHRMLAQLVGARRPTVSTACGDLARRGELVRNPDGTWLLTGDPIGAPGPEAERFVPPRRRMLQLAEPNGGPAPGAPALELTGGPDASPLALLERLGALRDAGVVSPREFAAKKRELLARL
jgi:CRP/FNR family cyclic AMP-dependent transcriptional regulator